MLTDKGDVQTQGTHLFFVDRTGTPALVKMTCPTGITGLTGGARDQIEDTCLDATDERTYTAGLATPSDISVPFNMKPQDAGHQLLFTLKETGESVDWIACLSESATAPTFAGDAIVPPADRTSFTFSGYVSDVSLDVATNEIVRGTVTIRRSGGVTPHWVA